MCREFGVTRQGYYRRLAGGPSEFCEALRYAEREQRLCSDHGVVRLMGEFDGITSELE